jgi:hypothetical protein
VGAGMVVVVVIAVFAFVVVVVNVSYAIIVAVSSSVVVTGFQISRNVFGVVPNHFTRKHETRVGHKVTTAGEFLSIFLYQSSASKSNLQWL